MPASYFTAFRSLVGDISESRYDSFLLSLAAALKMWYNTINAGVAQR